jgi:riboflavin biosynthesis pyrimidine reductase
MPWRNRGLKRVPIEGGAATVSAFISGDAVNRLHVLFAPLARWNHSPSNVRKSKDPARHFR